MSKEQVVERILSDAKAEADEIVQAARGQAEQILADAAARCDALKRETEADVAAYRQAAMEKKQAAARLESAKIVLREKRKVIDYIYAQALSRLRSLEKEDALRLAERLLTAYAETGDEIFFAENYRFEQEVLALPVAKEKQLKAGGERLAIDGGFCLKGKVSDKNLSYSALLAADREEFQAAVAKDIF